MPGGAAGGRELGGQDHRHRHRGCAGRGRQGGWLGRSGRAEWGLQGILLGRGDRAPRLRLRGGQALDRPGRQPVRRRLRAQLGRARAEQEGQQAEPDLLIAAVCALLELGDERPARAGVVVLEDIDQALIEDVDPLLQHRGLGLLDQAVEPALPGLQDRLARARGVHQRGQPGVAQAPQQLRSARRAQPGVGLGHVPRRDRVRPRGGAGLDLLALAVREGLQRAGGAGLGVGLGGAVMA